MTHCQYSIRNIYLILPVADSLLSSFYFTSKLELFIIQCAAKKHVLDSVANFISRQPELFAKPLVIEALRQHLNLEQKSGLLKCLALIISSRKGLELSGQFDLIPLLISILLKGANDEEMTYAIIALKNCMLNEKTFRNSSIPWRVLEQVLIEKCYTKENALLQQVSLQALRIISDKSKVKEELSKVYKIQIRNIPCPTAESAKLKDDLLEWINYRNYKPNDSPKYSKLFI